MVARMVARDQPEVCVSRVSSRKDRQPDFTDREIEILDLLGDGLSQKDAAAELGISRRTIEGHLARIRRKTGAPTTAIVLLSRARHARGARAERGPLGSFTRVISTSIAR
jgi:DNA-binding CsgD family transcriptional regulator